MVVQPFLADRAAHAIRSHALRKLPPIPQYMSSIMISIV